MKDLRNRINKKISKNYNQRQKILSEVKQALDIDFNKISVYSANIKIFSKSNYASSAKKNESINNPTSLIDTSGKEIDDTQTKPLFRVELPDSLVGSQRYFYNGEEISGLSLAELSNLKDDLHYILKELEIEIDRLLS